ERRRQEELNTILPVSYTQTQRGIVNSPAGKFGFITEEGVEWSDTKLEVENKINAKYDAELAALEEPPIESEEQSLLTPEEEAVLLSVTNEERAKQQNLLNSDGLVRNHTNVQAYDPKFNIY